jgi:cytochrome c-type biogenesis protein CcmH/NrfG
LEKARDAARRAVEKSPDFAFGWSRLAELEFSLGRIDRAREAVEKSLRLAPRNAEAIALQGFLLAAKNKIGLCT